MSPGFSTRDRTYTTLSPACPQRDISVVLRKLLLVPIPGDCTNAHNV